MVHAGEMRRSDRAFSEAIRRGMSCADMFVFVRKRQRRYVIPETDTSEQSPSGVVK